MSQNLGPESVLAQADVMWREVAGETVILDGEGSVILGLNRTGGQMWALLDGKRSLSAIASVVATRYGEAAERDRVVSDILAFAELLLERGLARAAE